MKHLLFLLALVNSISSFAQKRITSAGYRVRTNATEFTIHFYALDGVLCTAEINAEKLKEPINFRVEKRLPNGFSMSAFSMLPTVNLGGKNRLVVEIIDGDIILKDAQNNLVGNAKWFYEGPVNGVGMHCENCLGEDESFGLLRKARALKE